MKYMVSPSTKAGAIVREARIAAGMTQHDLARASGISQQHVSLIESGAIQPLFETVETLLAKSGRSLELR